MSLLASEKNTAFSAGASSSKVTQARLERRASAKRASRALRIGAVLELLAKAMNGAEFRSASVHVVNELAKSLGCERVSLGFSGLRKLTVCAISGTVDISPGQQSVRAVQSAMQEALDTNGIVVYPVPGSRGAVTPFMHAALAKSTGSAAICTVPLVVRGFSVGALLFERQDRFDSSFLESAKDAACFVGPVLELQYRASRPIAGQLISRRERLRKQFSRFPLSFNESIVAGLVIALLILAVWPVTLQVSSPARIEGAGQRVISAPVDGFIKSVSRRPGEKVSAGDLLVTLDSTDLKQTLEKWRVERSKLEREYRDALSQDNASDIVVTRARLTQANAQVAQAERDLDRSALVTPIDGVVVSQDLHETVGMPVKLGQELVTVTPEGAYRIVAEVDEQDISMVSAGQRGNVVFAALANQYLPVSVTRISPVAQTIEQRNSFEVDAKLNDPNLSLYHGLTGVARIDIDRRPLASVLWLRITQRTRRLFWRLVG
jgi:multidrug resistance efflux pump